MTEAIEKFFLETVGRELCVFFCSMLPIIECRGAVPLGFALGLPWWQTALFALAGNLLPVPFILLFIRAILRWMGKSRIKFFQKLVGWLNRKVEKHKGTIEKYSYWGVMIFVAIPFPGTGAWTGALVAALLDIRLRHAIPAIFVGLLMAAAITLAVTMGVIHLF